MNKKTVLLILIDGLRHDYINPVDSPFLCALGKQNIDAIVKETFAFELRPAFFAGLQPEECDVANMFCYDPTNSPFRSIDVSNGDRVKITQELRAEAEKRGYTLVKHIGSCADIPLNLLKYFDFSEKYNTSDPGAIPSHKTLFDYLRNDGKKWLWIAYPDGPAITKGVLEKFLATVAGDEDFIYLHFSELDWVGHEFGPHSIEQKRTLLEIDEAIRKVFCKLNQSFTDVRSVIFGDHGQVKIKKNIDIESKLKKTGLVLEKDYLCFLDSTQARFWFFNAAAKKKIIDLLRTFPDGKILTAADLKRLRSCFKHNKFGELIFVVNDGVGIFPNFFQHGNPCKGLHGYLPEVEGNWAKLIVAGCGITKKIGGPIEMVSLFPTLLEMLGYKKSSSTQVQSIFELENMGGSTEKYSASIVMPTYNRLNILKKCITAIEEQGYPKEKYELIVVNDGSTDGTKGFLEEYQKKTKLNFKHFNQRNAGPSAARNLGIKNAEGHTIILIGDDMIMGPKFIENHINFHRVNPQLSHACLGFIDWSKDIEISPFMKLITSKEGGQQFNYDYVEKQDPENIGYTVFWSSNVSFKRLFCVTHGLFNDKVFKHAMWEDIELGYRLEKAGLILHFRKDYKVYHEHKINFERFAERQRMVGWYSHDLSHLGIPSEYSCGGHERDMLYSKDALKDIVKAVKEYELENKKNDLPLMNKIYNSALYYAALVGYKEREEKLKRKVGGIVALLYNLLLKKEQIHSKDAHICTIEATIRDRDTHIGNLNGIINDKGVLISNLETAIRDKDAHIANLDGIIKDKDIQISTLENTRMKIESSLSYKVGNIIVFLLAAIREHLDYIMRIIKDSFLFNKNRISKFPAEFGFRGCLDSPQKNESFTTLTGWFLSHKKIHKVELYICKKKISDISLNKYRPDVKAAWPKYDHHEYNGYEYALPEQVIKKYAGKRSTIFLRFYLDDKQYVDRFKTPVKFPDGSFLPSNWIPLLKYIGDKKVLPPTNQQPQQNTPPIVCKRFALYTSSLGNYFFWEIRDLISAGLEELGFEVDIRDENGGYSGDANWHLVIAPHEFFYLGNGEKMRNQESPHNLVLINSEQPSTQWFSLSRDCFPKAHRIWDIDHNSYKVIAKKGYRCDFLPLGYVPRLELFNEVEKLPDHYGTYSLDASVRERSYFRKPYSSRPIDVMFVGNLTKRREEFFAKSAPVLSQYSSYFHFSDHLRPLLPGKTTFMDTRTVVGLAQRSKILLNIHQGQDVYFEWQRIVMQGIWQKTLVISEPCSSAPPFRPNIDFVEATLGEMSKKINYYLSTKKGLIEARAITEQGFKTLTKKCRLTDALRPLIMQLYVPGSQRVFWASPVRMNIFKRDIK